MLWRLLTQQTVLACFGHRDELVVFNNEEILLCAVYATKPYSSNLEPLLPKHLERIQPLKSDSKKKYLLQYHTCLYEFHDCICSAMQNFMGTGA